MDVKYVGEVRHGVINLTLSENAQGWELRKMWQYQVTSLRPDISLLTTGRPSNVPEVWSAAIGRASVSARENVKQLFELKVKE